MTNRNYNPNNEILQIIAKIDEFKGQWQALKDISPEKLINLKKIATIESVGSSTRIEGSKLSDEQVDKFLSKINKKSFKTRDEQEVAGYAEVMDLIFSSYENISLTENYIKQLHSILLKYSNKDKKHKGEYKKIENNVEAFDTNGKSIGIIFKTATPFETPYKMENLIKWTKKSLDEQSLHPLLIIAIFIVEFLAIHPFQDGNGRLSRILTTLLLIKLNYQYVPYASIESIIEENKHIYYSSLRRTQRTLEKEKPDYEPWIRFFLNILLKQKDNLKRKIELENNKNNNLYNLPKMSSDILNAINKLKNPKISDILELTNINRNTVKLHLKKLVKNNYIEKFGKGKGTWYKIKKPS